MMKYIKIILPVAVLATTLFWMGCNKDPEPRCVDQAVDLTLDQAQQAQLLDDLDSIDSYLAETLTEIEMEEVEIEPLSKIRYRIHAAGDGNTATYCSAVSMEYEGKFMNGDVFDETSLGSTFAYYLDGLIVGWQVGVPLIAEGGSITLYVPSVYAYGESGAYDRDGNEVIPPNTNLVFTIDLIAVQ